MDDKKPDKKTEQKSDSDKRLYAVWCYDSETGEQALIDRKTNTIIARKDKDGNIKEVRDGV